MEFRWRSGWWWSCAEKVPGEFATGHVFVREPGGECAELGARRSASSKAPYGSPKRSPRRRPDSRPRRKLTGKKLGDLKKPLPKKNLATRAGNLRSFTVKFVLNSYSSSKIGRGSGTFPAGIPTPDTPSHRLRPSFPCNPLSPPSPPLRSGGFTALPPKVNS